MIQINDWKDFSVIEKTEKLLQHGDVVVTDTDTVVGLLAMATQDGKDALDRIKQRADMPYLLLAHDLEAAQCYSDAFHHGIVKKIAEQFWPGPLTLIVPAKAYVPPYMKSEKGGIAIRIPDHEGLQKLLHHFGVLFSTSANLSGKPVPETISQIDSSILGEIALIVGNPDAREVTPSTILDCTSDQIKLVREGAISREQLKGYL